MLAQEKISQVGKRRIWLTIIGITAPLWLPWLCLLVGNLDLLAGKDVSHLLDLTKPMLMGIVILPLIIVLYYLSLVKSIGGFFGLLVVFLSILIVEYSVTAMLVLSYLWF